MTLLGSVQTTTSVVVMILKKMEKVYRKFMGFRREAAENAEKHGLTTGGDTFIIRNT